MSDYHRAYEHWRQDPEGFWSVAAKAIDWIKPWDKVYAKVDGLDRWFVGAECNTCWNAVDRHVTAGHGARTALIYDSPLAGRKQSYTYAELQDEVATLAAVLADLGIAKGDRVLIYMPMIPQALFAMLSCARIGAIHSVVFGGFAPAELASMTPDPSSSCRPHAASSPGASSPISRSSTRR
jgi:propionyl-CoA synthetase